ncbi:MAG: hypothetical protein LBB23_00675 [Rickettsiales bacterium]|jgi:hypothetical protein|nr:hypothetical protein [Rickettsiales bacterium]
MTKTLIKPNFTRVSEDQYEIYGLPYSRSQILVVSADGYGTLDGNNHYYWKPEYRFDPHCQDTVGEDFSGVVKLGKRYNIKIERVLSVPIADVGQDLSGQMVGDVIPSAYNFDQPNNPCNVLCVPLGKGDRSFHAGVFSFRHETLEHFTSAGWDTQHVLDKYESLQPHFRSYSPFMINWFLLDKDEYFQWTLGDKLKSLFGCNYRS